MPCLISQNNEIPTLPQVFNGDYVAFITEHTEPYKNKVSALIDIYHAGAYELYLGRILTVVKKGNVVCEYNNKGILIQTFTEDEDGKCITYEITPKCN